jgi:hypothetical protein
MKKSNTKSSKSPAPATKPAPSAVKTAPAAKAAVSKTKAATSIPSPKPAAPAIKPVLPTKVVTTVTALIDVGFGNTLYLRGDGPGLSWDKGVPLQSVADDKWSIVLPESGRPVIFKFLLNDVTWCTGEDFTVAPGTSITLTPLF